MNTVQVMSLYFSKRNTLATCCQILGHAYIMYITTLYIQVLNIAHLKMYLHIVISLL